MTSLSLFFCHLSLTIIQNRQKKFAFPLDKTKEMYYNIVISAKYVIGKRGAPSNEKNIPAQKASKKSRTRFQKTYEDCQRQKGTQKKTCKRKSKTHILIPAFHKDTRRRFSVALSLKSSHEKRTSSCICPLWFAKPSSYCVIRKICFSNPP